MHNSTLQFTFFSITSCLLKLLSVSLLIVSLTRVCTICSNLSDSILRNFQSISDFPCRSIKLIQQQQQKRKHFNPTVLRTAKLFIVLAVQNAIELSRPTLLAISSSCFGHTTALSDQSFPFQGNSGDNFRFPNFKNFYRVSIYLPSARECEEKDRKIIRLIVKVYLYISKAQILFLFWLKMELVSQ